MNGNRQKSTESTGSLSPEQITVIMVLMQGASVTAATEQAHVDRSTFYLWMRSDFVFQAELNRARQERASLMRSTLLSLSGTAISTVRELLENPETSPGIRLKAALAVLQATGTLAPEEIGQTSPAGLQAQMGSRIMIEGLFGSV